MKGVYITGKQRAGKDTAGNFMRFYGFSTYNLADGIYEIATKYFKMKRKDRQLLIAIGEKMREIDPTVWINYTLNRIESDELAVITDVRLPIEAEILKNNGYIGIKIEASQEVRAQREGYNPEFENHETENYDIPYDYVLDNNSNIMQDFEEKVIDFVKKVLLSGK
jgi:dephospho-CoA kinase